MPIAKEMKGEESSCNTCHHISYLHNLVLDGAGHQDLVSVPLIWIYVWTLHADVQS